MKALLFLSGFFTLAAQTAMVREVLATGGANELILGVLLGAWLAWVGAGAFLARIFPVEDKGKAARQARLVSFFYLPGALLQVTGTLFLRKITGTSPGDYFSLQALLPALLALGAPVSIVTGFLFSRASAALAGSRPGRATTLAYALESLGSLSGGGLFTLWLSLGGGTTAGLLLAGGILYAWTATRGFPKKAALWVPPGILAAAALLSALWPGDPAGRLTGELRFRLLHQGADLLESVETPFGLTEIARMGEQVLVFQDGSLRSSSPDKEQAALQSGILAAQPARRNRILFLGSPPPSLLADLLEYPWNRLVVVDPDRPAREAVERWLPPRERKARRSPKVSWVHDDPRPFLARGGDGLGPFDLVVVACSDLGKAAAGRNFTREALAGIRSLLARGGVLALGAPLVERAFDKEKLDFGLSLLATLENVFPKVELVPGVFAWFLASRIDGNPTGDGREMEKRLLEKKILPSFLPRGALASACDPIRGRGILDFLHGEEARRGRAPLHTDSRPTLFFAGLAVETRYRDPGLARILAALGRAGVPALAWPLGALIFLLLIRLLSSPPDEKRSSETTALLAVSAAGGAGITLFLVLLLSFQCKAGLLYEKVGLASGLFLAGISLGAFLGGMKGTPRFLLGLAAAGYLLLSLPDLPTLPQNILLALFFGGGLASGLAFPAGTALLGGAGRGEGNIASRLEAADHLGAALGGTAAGMLLVPVLGLRGTTLFCGILLFCLFLFSLLRPGRPGTLLTRISARVFPGARGEKLPKHAGFPWPRAGFFMLWTGTMLLGLVPMVRARMERPASLIPPGAVRFLGGDKLVIEKKPFLHGVALKKNGKEPLGTLFAASAVIPDVYGYAGPIDLLVVFDRKWVIRHVQVLSWEETPSYVEGAEKWLRKAFVGRKVGDLFVLRQDSKKGGGAVVPVDGMAGATITSRALVEIMTRAGKKARALLSGQEPIPIEKTGGRSFDPSFWYLLLAFPLGMIVYLMGGKPVRRLFLASSFLLGGILFAVQLAPATLASLWLHGISQNPQLLLLTAGGLVSAVLFGPAYCASLCPLGAAQEACSWPGFQFRPPRNHDRYFRSIKYFLLLGVILHIAWTGDQGILAFDPLAAAFGPGRTLWTGLLLLLILLCSFFFFRFWCRYLCPLGAFFQLFSPTAPLLKFAPSPNPKECDTGILHPLEADCLHCRRCSTGETAPRNQTYKSPLLLALALLCALFLAAGGARQALLPPPASTAPNLPRSTSTLRKVDKHLLKKLLDSGDLVPHPAEYHK